MGEPPRTGAARAFVDGIAGVAGAPAILAGTVALAAFYGPPSDLRHSAGALLLWAFLSGGVLDRYARRRPTRARGFFAACGAHLGTMLRLGLTVLLLLAAFHLAIGGDFPNDYVHEAAFVGALAIVAVLSFAQVRVAVEDRRSALGAWLAGGRFLARNPGALLPFVAIVAAALATMLVWERVEPSVRPVTWMDWTAAVSFLAVECFLALTWLATAVSLFQSRLAHAGYTAGPPLTWPDSPAAEAIANAARTPAP